MIGEEKDDLPATTVAYKTSYHKITKENTCKRVQHFGTREKYCQTRVEFFCQSNCPKNYKMLLLPQVLPAFFNKIGFFVG